MRFLYSALSALLAAPAAAQLRAAAIVEPIAPVSGLSAPLALSGGAQAPLAAAGAASAAGLPQALVFGPIISAGAPQSALALPPALPAAPAARAGAAAEPRPALAEPSGPAYGRLDRAIDWLAAAASPRLPLAGGAFDGSRYLAPSPEPAPHPPSGLPAVQWGVEAMLEHVAKTPTRWKDREEVSAEMIRRLEQIRFNGGIARKVREGWFGSRIEITPVPHEVVEMIPAMVSTLRLLAGRHWNRELWGSPAQQFLRDASDYLYSFGTLAKRAASVEKLQAELVWLHGTYRLGRD